MYNPNLRLGKQFLCFVITIGTTYIIRCERLPVRNINTEMESSPVCRF